MMQIFYILPFMVCLIWLANYLLKIRNSYPAQRIMAVFCLTCTLLYLCHYVYFINDCQRNYIFESIYTLCTLSVYPLYYIYICQMTSGGTFRTRRLWLLLPAFICFVLKLFFFDSIELIYAVRIIGIIQVILVLIYGTKRLRNYDSAVVNFYADTEGRELYSLERLLICVVIISVLSAICIYLGREVFASNGIYICIPSILFSVMLFALFYDGWTIPDNYPAIAEMIKAKTSEIDDISIDHIPENDLNAKLVWAIKQKKVFLDKNLQITDLAKMIGTNRTYLSRHINIEKQMTFSEFINSCRIEYAQEQIRQMHDAYSISALSDASGFSNEVTFYRNFKKFTGTTPERWLKSIR